MARWTFNTDMDGWTSNLGSSFSWNAAGGYSGGGVKGVSVQDGDGISRTITATPVTAGAPFSFRCRVTSPDGGADIEDDVVVGIEFVAGNADHTFLANGIPNYDSGWVLISGTVFADDTVSLLEITVDGFDINQCIVYIDDVYFLESPGGQARFYHGLGSLSEKFTLPFSGVQPGAMTLNKSLGTVVIGQKAASPVPVVYSLYPYVTGTAAATGMPTGTSISSLKWV